MEKQIDKQIVAESVAKIKNSMEELGVWQPERPAEPAFSFKEAFASDTMTFLQWLQFVLIPTIEDKIKTNGPWPDESQVAVYAIQNLEDETYDKLKGYLADLDSIFNN